MPPTTRSRGVQRSSCRRSSRRRSEPDKVKMSCAIRFRPKRVLELADELRLSESQRAAVRAAFEHMHAEPVRLGDRILAAEAELDRLFGDARADADSVNTRRSLRSPGAGRAARCSPAGASRDAPNADGVAGRRIRPAPRLRQRPSRAAPLTASSYTGNIRAQHAFPTATDNTIARRPAIAARLLETGRYVV